MTTDDGTTHAAVPGAPVLLVVDADPEARAVTESALARRFGPDYRVLAADAPQAGLDMLERLAERGDQVALVAADLHLPGVDGVEFLERAHLLHRGASRALLVAMDRYHTRIPLSELATLQRTTALSRIDFSVVKGWVTPEEWLYPLVQEALSAWTVANRPRHVVYRIVGEQWSPRSHQLRDLLTRNGVPFEFHPAGSERGQELIRQFGIDAHRLPALVRHDGSVLHDPGDAEVAAAHGITTTTSSEVYDLAIIGGGRVGLFRGVGVGDVEDVDDRFSKATRAGAKAIRPVQDQFYGDRSGTLEDPYGHVWTVATHKEDVSPEEIDKRAQALFNQK